MNSFADDDESSLLSMLTIFRDNKARSPAG